MVLLPVENPAAVGTRNNLFAGFYLIEELRGDIHVTPKTAAVFYGNYGEFRSFLLYPVIDI